MREKVSYLYFFRVPKKYFGGIYWNYLGKNYFYIIILTLNVMYTIMSTSIVFLIKVSTQTMSTMVFEPCVLSPLRPHDPTSVFHKVNIKSFSTSRQINFCNFYVNIWSPCSSNTSIQHTSSFSNLPNFGYCDRLINQNAAYVIGRS